MIIPAWAKRAFHSPHFQYGVPFLTLLVGASFVLRDLNHTRYEYRRQKRVKEQLEKGTEAAGIKVQKVKPQEVLEKHIKEEVQDNYDMVRGPRPWEDGEPLNKDNKKIKRMAKSYDTSAL